MKIVPVLGQMSGSVGGLTFQGGRFGQVARRKTSGVNPLTRRQQQARAAFATPVSYWGNGLSSAQREAWNLYASETARQDVFGQTIYWTGFQTFVQAVTWWGFIRLVYGGNRSFPSNAPVGGGLASPPAVQGVTTALASDNSTNPNTFQINVASMAPGSGGFDVDSIQSQVVFYFLLDSADDFGYVPNKPKPFGMAQGNAGSPPSTVSIDSPISLTEGRIVTVAFQYMNDSNRFSPRIVGQVTVTSDA